MAKQGAQSQVSQSARVLYRLLADAASRTVVGATDRSTFDLVEKAADADRVLFSPKGRLSRTVIEQAWRELVDGGYVRGRRFKRPAAPLAGAGAKAPTSTATAAPAAPPTSAATAKPAAAKPAAAKRSARKPAAAAPAAGAKPAATPAARKASATKRPARVTTAKRPATAAKSAPAAAARRSARRTAGTARRGAGGRVQAAERQLSQLDQTIGRLEGDLVAAQRKRALLATRLAEIDRLINDLS